MPPTDARTDLRTAPTPESDAGFRTGGDSEDTLELRLPDDFLALYGDARQGGGHRPPVARRRSPRPHRGLGAEPSRPQARSSSSPWRSSAICRSSAAG